MESVVLFGVGSPIIADLEESLARRGCSVHAAIRNHPGETHVQNTEHLVDLDQVTNEMKLRPFLVPLFTPAHRQHAAAEARNLGFHSAYTLIDPTATYPRLLKHGPGLYINAGCNIGAACSFDEFVFINRGVNLGHHACLGRFVSVGPGAVIAGLVTLSDGVAIGAGGVVLPKVTVGPNAVVGAGAVVTKDVPAHCLVVGNPARIVKTDIPGYGDRSVT